MMPSSESVNGTLTPVSGTPPPRVLTEDCYAYENDDVVVFARKPSGVTDHFYNRAGQTVYTLHLDGKDEFERRTNMRVMVAEEAAKNGLHWHLVVFYVGTSEGCHYIFRRIPSAVRKN